MIAAASRSRYGASASVMPRDPDRDHLRLRPFALPLLRTEKAKRSGASSVSGNESAMRRTSACVAIDVPQNRARPGVTTRKTDSCRNRRLYSAMIARIAASASAERGA